ncbi:MAG: 60S ribosomal export protein NMD3 [Thermoplasmatota archaeon]
MICVDCGADSDGLIGGSCAACFAKRTQLLAVPDVVQLELCANCQARHVGAHWHDVAPETPEEWLRHEAVHEACGVHHEVEDVHLDLGERQLDDRTFAYEIQMTGNVQDVPVSADAACQLRRIRGVCDRCSRIAGGYYAAIIQLRATERDVTPPELERAHQLISAELNRALDAGNRFAFVAKGGPMHGGWDYYVGDIDAARNVSRIFKERLSAAVTETAKLVGRREGEDVYRVTFLVRIRKFAPGDIAIKDHRPYAVVQVHPKSMQVLDLETHQRTRMHEDDAKRLGGLELFEDAVLVSQDATGVQVMDPKSYQTVTLLCPEPIGPEGIVPVIRFEERLYWAPRS